MGHAYKAIQWTPFKKRYDFVLAIGVGAFAVGFAGAAFMAASPADPPSAPQLLARAAGAAAMALLTLILAIGPLARLTPRALPLLYNRRHLGVTCFALALVHASLVIVWYHGFSDANPLVSLLVSNPRYDAVQGFPFESLGLFALCVLFVLAATSHDFWNANLGPGVWKALHMGAYAAFAALIAHVMLGAVQNDRGLASAIVVGVAAIGIASLHVIVGWREAARDAVRTTMSADGWLEVGPAHAIPDGRARIVTPAAGERIAVFRDGARIHAISNRCRHQGGPLGEGRIIDGCVTCPWHGFQYRPDDGCSPPPFTERVPTYRTAIRAGIVFVDPTPLPLGVAPPETVAA